MIAQDKCCSFFFLKDYLAGYLKFYSLGSTMYISKTPFIDSLIQSSCFN